MKMDLEMGLLTRRSTRRFVKNRTIPDKTLQEVLNIAMHAPSAKDTQEWHFIVVKDKNILNKIDEIGTNNAPFIKDASAAIVVCGDLREQSLEDAWIVDTANASLQLALACHAKGLGSCWSGIFPDKERMQKFSILLELPPHIEPLSMVIIGYKLEETPQPLNRFDITKIHTNRW